MQEEMGTWTQTNGKRWPKAAPLFDSTTGTTAQPIMHALTRTLLAQITIKRLMPSQEAAP